MWVLLEGRYALQDKAWTDNGLRGWSYADSIAQAVCVLEEATKEGWCISPLQSFYPPDLNIPTTWFEAR
jgi:hypothetical protein